MTTQRAIVRPARRFRGSIAHKAVRKVRSQNLGVRPAIPPNQKRELIAHYRPQLLELSETTGFDVSDWISSYEEVDEQ